MGIALAGRDVGEEAPCLVVAEIGSNHDGSLDRALALVDAAAAAGACAVDFHSFRAATLLARRWPTPEGRWRSVEAYGQLERLELPSDWHVRLRDHAASRGLLFLATPFDEDRAALLAALGVPALAVAPGDLTHLPLLRCLGGFGRPVLLATDAATLEEVEAALAALAEGAGATERTPPVVLVHGPGPAPGDLRLLPSLAARFGFLAGWRDRLPGTAVALAAVGLGAVTVAKPLSDDPARRGPDHSGALTPEEFGAFVTAVRTIEAHLGDGHWRSAAAGEDAMWQRRSVYAARSLPAGTVLQESDLKLVRPGIGLPPSALGRLLGRRLRRAVPIDQPLREGDGD